MNKIYVFTILGLVLVAGSAMAYQGWQENDRGLFHEDMELIVEEGSYADLEALREETGRPLVRWVQNEDDFAEWQDRHGEMEAQYGEGPHYDLRNGQGMNRGGHGQHHGLRGGCQ